MAVTGFTLLALAARLEPLAAGFGTHQQLGLGPCSFPLIFGIPCPTCGMTTALAYFAQGHPLASFHAQPAGFAIACCLALAVGAGLTFLILGRAWGINWYRGRPTWGTAALAAVLLLGWIYKVATVALLQKP